VSVPLVRAPATNARLVLTTRRPEAASVALIVDNASMVRLSVTVGSADETSVDELSEKLAPGVSWPTHAHVELLSSNTSRFIAFTLLAVVPLAVKDEAFNSSSSST